MAKLKLTGKELRQIGYPEGPVISLAMNVMEKNFKHLAKEDALEILSSVLQSPNQYAHDGVLNKIAEALLPKPKVGADELPLAEKGIDFNVFGAEGIEQGALHQMSTAAKLPVAVAGALMPDAHHGYGLPIGGVLATENAVIPYGVGVDIGCFTGETKVKLADGRALSFLELIEEDKAGKVNFTFSIDESSNVVIAKIRAPRQTRLVNELLEISLDNGERYRCTTDHVHYLRSGVEIRAMDLKAGDSLMPCYTDLGKNIPAQQKSFLDKWVKSEEYPVAYNPASNLYDSVHFLTDDYSLKQGVCTKEAGKNIRHHADIDKHPRSFAEIKNHKVISVTKVSCSNMPVYCLTVDEHENFALDAGVFVHNCRMALSVFDINPKELTDREHYFTRELNEATLFGSGSVFQKPADHEVMERKEFDELGLLKGLQDRAWKQLGSSGSGNHFVEWGIVEIKEKDAVLGIEAGTYIGLLSHSGSRALGANVANHYTKLAKEKRRLPGDAVNLAWLSLDEQEGIEYWMAMNLAGDYASACHHVIHDKISKQLGRKPLTMVENHHNFAWRETWEGKDVIVHRKGATPAGKDVLGIIPGSMAAPGFIVKGKGEAASVNSASHGAGRKMSRTAALKTVTHKELNEALAKQGVKLLGGGLDEAPFAYKDIHEVMKAQSALVETAGIFYPKIVKMDGAQPKQWRKGKSDAIMGE